MPVLDGDICSKILRETYKDRDFKIIMVTADVSFIKPNYIDHLLYKPTNIKELKSCILSKSIRTQ